MGPYSSLRLEDLVFRNLLLVIRWWWLGYTTAEQALPSWHLLLVWNQLICGVTYSKRALRVELVVSSSSTSLLHHHGIGVRMGELLPESVRSWKWYYILLSVEMGRRFKVRLHEWSEIRLHRDPDNDLLLLSVHRLEIWWLIEGVWSNLTWRLVEAVRHP
jgi:hypothetical protein